MISPFAPVNLPQLEKSTINTKILSSGDSPSSKVDMQEIDRMVNPDYDENHPKKRQKINGNDDTAKVGRQQSAQVKAVQELASGLVDHMANQMKNSGGPISNITDQKAGINDSNKQKWVPLDQFLSLQ